MPSGLGDGSAWSRNATTPVAKIASRVTAIRKAMCFPS